MTITLKQGNIYTTNDGRDVEVLRLNDRKDAAACLVESYLLCWYSLDGKCQIWDSKEKDHIFIGEIKKGCPFCGNEADTNSDGKGCSGKYYLSCMGPECEMHGPVKKTLAEAIAAWNKRETA